MACQADGPGWSRIAISVGAGFVGLICAWQILVFYSFATMLDPQIVGDERQRMIAERFLFGESRLQIVLICGLIWLASTGLVASVVFGASAMARRGTWSALVIASGLAGLAITCALVSRLLLP